MTVPTFLLVGALLSVIALASYRILLRQVKKSERAASIWKTWSSLFTLGAIIVIDNLVNFRAAVLTGVTLGCVRYVIMESFIETHTAKEKNE